MKEKFELLEKLIFDIEEEAIMMDEAIEENLVACSSCAFMENDANRMYCSLKHVFVDKDQACLKGLENNAAKVNGNVLQAVEVIKAHCDSRLEMDDMCKDCVLNQYCGVVPISWKVEK